MTTSLQRLLNVVAILIFPIPVISSTVFFLEAGGERAYAPLVGLLACTPILVLASVNFVLYRRFTVWHSSDESMMSRNKQVLLALIPTGAICAYSMSVMIFYWMDTRPLYLDCAVTNSENPKDIGGSFLFGIRHTPPLRQYSNNGYWAYEGSGWMAETAIYLGIAAWDFESESWGDVLAYDEYHPNTEWIDRRDGGLIVREAALLSQGWRVNAEKAAEGAEHDAFMKSVQPGRLEIKDKYHEPFDRLTISRETGHFVMAGGFEGVCRKSRAPKATKAAAKGANNKF